mgnify:CR=1 FL=1
MLWICLTAWAGLFIWYFRMRKKAEDHKLVRRIFCLAATGFIAGTALCLQTDVASYRLNRPIFMGNFNWNGVP